MGSRTENEFQRRLIRDIQAMLPGCYILKNDSGYIQGIPDLTILYEDRWAMLECKRSLRSPYQPNQEEYLRELDDMSFASMICPENREEILDGLQRSLKTRRNARVPFSE